MGNIRLFFSTKLIADMTDKLDKAQSHYLIRVMRIKENDVFSLFNLSLIHISRAHET